MAMIALNTVVLMMKVLALSFRVGQAGHRPHTRCMTSLRKSHFLQRTVNSYGGNSNVGYDGSIEIAMT